MSASGIGGGSSADTAMAIVAAAADRSPVDPLASERQRQADKAIKRKQEEGKKTGKNIERQAANIQHTNETAQADHVVKHAAYQSAEAALAKFATVMNFPTVDAIIPKAKDQNKNQVLDDLSKMKHEGPATARRLVGLTDQSSSRDKHANKLGVLSVKNEFIFRTRKQGYLSSKIKAYKEARKQGGLTRKLHEHEDWFAADNVTELPLITVLSTPELVRRRPGEIHARNSMEKYGTDSWDEVHESYWKTWPELMEADGLRPLGLQILNHVTFHRLLNVADSDERLAFNDVAKAMRDLGRATDTMKTSSEKFCASKQSTKEKRSTVRTGRSPAAAPPTLTLNDAGFALAREEAKDTPYDDDSFFDDSTSGDDEDAGPVADWSVYLEKGLDVGEAARDKEKYRQSLSEKLQEISDRDGRRTTAFGFRLVTADDGMQKFQAQKLDDSYPPELLISPVLPVRDGAVSPSKRTMEQEEVVSKKRLPLASILTHNTSTTDTSDCEKLNSDLMFITRLSVPHTSRSRSQQYLAEDALKYISNVLEESFALVWSFAPYFYELKKNEPRWRLFGDGRSYVNKEYADWHNSIIIFHSQEEYWSPDPDSGCRLLISPEDNTVLYKMPPYAAVKDSTTKHLSVDFNRLKTFYNGLYLEVKGAVECTMMRLADQVYAQQNTELHLQRGPRLFQHDPVASEMAMKNGLHIRILPRPILCLNVDEEESLTKQYPNDGFFYATEIALQKDNGIWFVYCRGKFFSVKDGVYRPFLLDSEGAVAAPDTGVWKQGDDDLIDEDCGGYDEPDVLNSLHTASSIDGLFDDDIGYGEDITVEEAIELLQ